MDWEDAALRADEADADTGFVLDAPYPGAPLLLCFGFVDWDRPPRFDFARRLRRMRAQGGQPINLLLLRDCANLWYQHGIAGLGSDVASTVDAIAAIIARVAPSFVGAVGQSMGAYGAILFGSLLGVDQILAFGPLSYLRSDWARRDGDLRWLAVMETLDRFPPPIRYDDLPALLDSLDTRPALHLVYGTRPAPSDEPANLDALHLNRFRALADVSIEAHDMAPHAVAKWLIDEGRMDALIKAVLLPPQTGSLPEPDFTRRVKRDVPDTGKPRPTVARAIAPCALPAPPARVFDDGWRGWIAENIVLGANPDELLDVLVREGFRAGTARVEIAKAQRSPYLAPARKLTARVAKRDWTLDVQKRLRALGPAHHGTASVPRRHRLSADAFLADHYAANCPVVITGMMDDWPALGWTLPALAARLGDRAVQVQGGRTANSRYEIEADRHRQTMALDRFIHEAQAHGGGNNLYMTANNGSANAAALAPLWHDVGTLPEYLAPDNAGGFFWIGPAGTVTPTHHDLTNNFMAQLVGRKRIHLVNALEATRLYNRTHVYSDVDLEAIDYARFPAMRDVEVLVCDLAPGELLFLPVGWWHHVRALDASVTITFTNFAFPNDFYATYHTFQDV